MKREGKVWIRVFPDKPLTRKPAEVRMGKGKGAPELWVAVLKPGRIIFEAEGVPPRNCTRSPSPCSAKAPSCRTKFIVRPDYTE
jgi:large subunit ribosomal protein L16